MMRTLLGWLLFFLIAAGSGYAAYATVAPVRNAVLAVQQRIAPCSSPVTYSIGSIDPRFRVATSTLITDLGEAAAIWDDPTGRHLFQYEPSGGAVTVNLVYDERQASADKLASLGYRISTSKATYDELKSRYDSLSATVASEKSALEQASAAYQAAQAAYNAEVEKWNAGGGAPPAAYTQLQQEKTALEAQYASAQAAERSVNADIETLNALATTLNQLIVQLNLNVQQYNGTGAAAGQFEEGLYQVQGGVRTIDVYEFTSHVQLVRVLAHEMGHSLGLQHVTDPNAIMYKMNEGTSLKATAADLAELKAVCSSGL